MDQVRTGERIRAARLQKGLTQLSLARLLHVSDKAVSKWERGRGCPDLSTLPLLADVLGLDMAALLTEEEESGMRNDNLKKLKVYVCPECGNVLFGLDEAQIACCGQRLTPMQPQKAEAEDRLHTEHMDGGWYVSSPHEMTKEHYVSFVALLTGDTLIVKKLYPEWGLETRLPDIKYGILLWYCTQHGLFSQMLK